MKKIYKDKNLNKIRNKEIRKLNDEKRIPKMYKKVKLKMQDAKIKELKEMTLI